MDFISWTKARLVNWIASKRAMTQSQLSKLRKNQLVDIAKSIDVKPCLSPYKFNGFTIRCGRCVNCHTVKEHRSCLCQKK